MHPSCNAGGSKRMLCLPLDPSSLLVVDLGAVVENCACRDAMREGASDDDLRAIVSAAVDRKKAAHAGMFELAAAPNRAMVKIGG